MVPIEPAMKLHEAFRLAAILRTESAAADDDEHGMRPLQVGDPPALRGVVEKLVVGKDGSWNNVRSHVNSSTVVRDYLRG